MKSTKVCDTATRVAVGRTGDMQRVREARTQAMVEEVLDTQPPAPEEEAAAFRGVTLNRHERRKRDKMQRRAATDARMAKREARRRRAA